MKTLKLVFDSTVFAAFIAVFGSIITELLREYLAERRRKREAEK